MNRILWFAAAGLLAASCSTQKMAAPGLKTKNTDRVYQYSLFTALANSIFDGTLTVSGVKTKGDMGLGTYNGLDGEMIVNNGKVYQFPAYGKVKMPTDKSLVPFTVVKFFQPDFVVETGMVTDYAELKKLAEKQFSSPNYIYALRVTGTFLRITCGSAEKQELPYEKTLSEAIANRPVFEWKNVEGTLVGFWFPEYVGGVNIPGFHLHFISADETKAGHVVEFEASGLKLEIDQSSGLEFDLPETEAFKTKVFDLSQGYNKPAAPAK
jgi:acetolactate decarboxylase